MSKWINKEYFDNYVKEKENEADHTSNEDFDRINRIWRTPERGSMETPKVYEGRFLQDPKGKYTKRFFYHLFQSGEKWRFVLCPKTFDFENWCPLCSVTTKLYKGSENDKKYAYNYKRKSKHVGNFYIIDDPRDADAQDESRKVNGTVKLYEFPDKVESKLRQEIVDKKHGRGGAIFDPGKDGFNFILKVKSTKKDKDGNIYADYSDSTFSSKPEALGSDSEIKKIMDSTYDIEAHITERIEPDEAIISVLKSEMLWDMIEDEWKKYKANSEDNKEEYKEDKTNNLDMTEDEWKKANSEDKTDEDDIPDFKAPKEEEKDDDISDEELLKELDELD